MGYDGECIFSELCEFGFDIFHSFAPDSMHQLWLGVTNQFVAHICKTKVSKSHIFFIFTIIHFACLLERWTGERRRGRRIQYRKMQTWRFIKSICSNQWTSQRIGSSVTFSSTSSWLWTITEICKVSGALERWVMTIIYVF